MLLKIIIYVKFSFYIMSSIASNRFYPLLKGAIGYIKKFLIAFIATLVPTPPEPPR